jgi:putative transcriptional regulator
MPEPFQSLKGHLLLDGGKLRGSFFNRTVVLICQHDADGAFGLVLNRPTENKVGEVLMAELADGLKEQTLFLGGPVQPEALSFVHSDTFLPEANVMPNVNLGNSLESLAELGSSFSTSQQVKIFAGYAGWTSGQLEDEMKRDSWLTHPASVELIFQTDPATLWQTILHQKGWQYRLLAEGPEDLSWN